MIPYLDRDLVRTFLFVFLGLMVFVQVGIFISFLLNMYSDVFAGEGNKVGWLLLYFILSMPRQIAITIPVVCSIGILWVYTTKARHNEILAYMVAGISPYRLAAPLLIVAGILSVGAYSITELLANDGDAAAERVKRVQIEGRSLDTITRERNVFQKGQQDRFYNIHGFQPMQGKMEMPVIFEMDEEWKHPKWRLEADSAELQETDRWVFTNAVYRQFNEKGEVTEFRRAARAVDVDILPVPLEGELTRYLKQRIRPSQMNFMELRDYIQLERLRNRPTYVYQTHMHFNIGIALGCFVMACLMIGHILRPSASTALIGFGGGLVLIGSYYGILLFARQAAMTGAIDPALGAYGTNLIFMLLAAFLLGRKRAL